MKLPCPELSLSPPLTRSTPSRRLLSSPTSTMPLSIVPCMLSRPTLNTESLMYQLSLMLLATLLPPLLLESLVMLVSLLVLPTLVTIIKLEKISFFRHLAVSPKLEFPPISSCLETVLCSEGSFSSSLLLSHEIPSTLIRGKSCKLIIWRCTIYNCVDFSWHFMEHCYEINMYFIMKKK